MQEPAQPAHETERTSRQDLVVAPRQSSLPLVLGAVLCASKTENACSVFDEIPRLLDELVVFIEEVHVDDQITGEKLASRLGLFASLDFLNPLGWDEDLVNEFGHFIRDDSAVDIVFHFLLLSGEDVHDEPLIFRG
jgi:hypothetical protein